MFLRISISENGIFSPYPNGISKEDMKTRCTAKECEDGFVLVTSMMIMLILTLIGILAIKSTVTELMISGGDKVRKQTFYQADGGSELAQHLIYQNAICSTTSGGFSSEMITSSIKVEDLDFSDNVTTDDLYDSISDSNRSFVYYPDEVIDDAVLHTNFLNTSTIKSSAGSGMLAGSGYDGTGVSVTSATAKVFTIASQHRGKVNSESTVVVRWQVDTSILTSASSFDCNY